MYVHVCFLVTDITEIIWSHPDVPQSLCSPISMFPGPMFPDLYVPRSYVPRSYVPQYLCSPVSMFPVLCSPIPMFPGPVFPGPYAPQSLCSPVPMFPDTYVPRYLFFFFWGGGGEGGMRSVGTICWHNWKISFLFQDGRHCHLRWFILFTFRRVGLLNITFPMTYRTRPLFLTPSCLSPAWQSWGGGRPQGRVQLSVKGGGGQEVLL